VTLRVSAYDPSAVASDRNVTAIVSLIGLDISSRGIGFEHNGAIRDQTEIGH
jgi:hypothetical protein